MKKLLLFSSLLLSLTLNAQLSSENFDSYNAGAFDAQWTAGSWTGWFGGVSNVEISTVQAHSSPNSMLVNSATDDIVALFGTLNQGTYEITFYQYIPLGFGSYFNVQHNYTNTVGDWAAEVYFGDNSINTARVVTNNINTTFTPIYDQWVENKLEFNFAADVAKYYYNGTLVHTWAITTNAAGGAAGLNQVNAINFYGACDGTGCATQGYFDDLTVVQTAVPAQHDATILTKNYPMPYTQIPDSLMTPMSLSAEVVNYGLQGVSNVQVTFNILDGSNNVVHTELSNIVSFLASNATATVYGGSGSYLPANMSDVYTITYDVSITEMDDNPQNNADTLLFDVMVTDSTYAKDDGNYTDGLGANAASPMLGQNFEFVEDVFVHSVTTSYVSGLAGDNISLVIYETDPITKLPINNVYTSAAYTLPAAGSGVGNEEYVTFHISPAIQLDSGLYSFAIHQMSLNNIGISTSEDIYLAGTTALSIDGGATWATAESFGFEVAFNIRPTVSLVPEVPINTKPIKNLEILEIQPNPTKGVFMVNLELSKKEAVKLDIFNVQGQLIQSKLMGDITNLQERIDLTNEGTGLYLVRLTIGNEVITKQVLVKN
jgi:hypothetical protein